MIALSLNTDSSLPNMNLDHVYLQVSVEYNLFLYPAQFLVQGGLQDGVTMAPGYPESLKTLLFTLTSSRSSERFWSSLKRQDHIYPEFHLSNPLSVFPWGITLTYTQSTSSIPSIWLPLLLTPSQNRLFPSPGFFRVSFFYILLHHNHQMPHSRPSKSESVGVTLQLLRWHWGTLSLRSWP